MESLIVTSDRLDLDDASLGQDLNHRTRRTTLFTKFPGNE